MSGPQWQSNQATGDSVGSRTRSRLPRLATTSGDTLVERRPRKPKLAMTTTGGAAPLTSVAPSAPAASITTAVGLVVSSSVAMAATASSGVRDLTREPPLGALEESSRRGGEEANDDDETGSYQSPALSPQELELMLPHDPSGASGPSSRLPEAFEEKRWTSREGNAKT